MVQGSDETPQKVATDENFRELLRVLPSMEDPRVLCESVYSMLEMMLRREGDKPLLDQLSELVGQIIGDIPFDQPPEEVREATRKAARACIKVLQTAKEKRTPARQDPENSHERQSRDVEYWLPPHLAHLLAHVEYATPELPKPEFLPSFDDLCLASIHARIDNVLVFFQRHNPSFRRELPPIFLFSEEFAAKLKRAIAKFIYPYIAGSRQVRVFATSVDLTKVDSRTFWDQVDDVLKAKLLSTWQQAWNDLRLIEAGEAEGGKVLQIKETTKLLREMLQPSAPDVYDLPRIANREIDLLCSLLNTEEDWWQRLNAEWQRFHDFYEQEMDPRVFQQRAREGVLRDNLLLAAAKFPEQWGDFLVLLCHRIFPRVTTYFLECYSANIGLSEKERERRAPYLMRYLAQVRQHPEIKERERLEGAEWEAQVKMLRQHMKGFSE